MAATKIATKMKPIRESRFMELITMFQIVNPYGYDLDVPLFAPAKNGLESMYVLPMDGIGVVYRQIQSDLMSNSWVVSNIRISVKDFPSITPKGGLPKSCSTDEITLKNRYGKALSMIRYNHEFIYGTKLSTPIDVKPFFARRFYKNSLDIKFTARITKESSLTIKVPPYTCFEVSLFCNLTDYFKGRRVDGINYLKRDTMLLINKCERDFHKIEKYQAVGFDTTHPYYRYAESCRMVINKLDTIRRMLRQNKENADIIQAYNLASEISENSAYLLKVFNSKDYIGEVKKWEASSKSKTKNKK